MSYTRVNWKDYPETTTPVNATNLNKMDEQIYQNTEDIESGAIVDITQSDYDDLTEEEQNAKVYHITDAGFDADAKNVAFASESGISATNVGGALDELNSNLDELDTAFSALISSVTATANTAVKIKDNVYAMRVVYTGAMASGSDVTIITLPDGSQNIKVLSGRVLLTGGISFYQGAYTVFSVYTTQIRCRQSATSTSTSSITAEAWILFTNDSLS